MSVIDLKTYREKPGPDFSNLNYLESQFFDECVKRDLDTLDFVETLRFLTIAKKIPGFEPPGL